MTTHASEVSENPRSALIDGNATFTIVVSRTIIRVPAQSTKSASHRLRESRLLESMVRAGPFGRAVGTVSSRGQTDAGGPNSSVEQR